MFKTSYFKYNKMKNKMNNLKNIMLQKSILDKIRFNLTQNVKMIEYSILKTGMKKEKNFGWKQNNLRKE